MFCVNCGSRLEESDIFCSGCGAKILEGQPNVESSNLSSNEVIFEVKPTFRFLYIALPRIIRELAYLIPMIITVVIMVTSLNKTFSNMSDTSIFKDIFTPMVVIIIAIPVIRILYVIIRLIIEKKQYDKITYTFYTNKVVFRDDFLNIAEKELKYTHIKEIVKKQTLIQRWLNIGNIVMYSNAESGYASGIALVNVENIDEVYRKIKEITHI